MRGWLRSHLRRMSQRWKPIYGKLNEGKRPVTAEDKAKYGNRIRYVYDCEVCHNWFPKREIEIDHIIPCGSIKDISTDVGPFVERLLCERDGLRRVCHECHHIITQSKE